MRIPFISLAGQHDPLREDLDSALSKVMDGNFFILGNALQAFEQEYAAYSVVKHCIGVANGSDAIYISLKVLGIGEGDEVVVPALTCAPTWMAVSRTGATIVPADVNPSTLLIDADGIQKTITTRTRAVVPVNLYGFPANVHRIMDVAKSRKIFVVEDNAQSHGAGLGASKTGAMGHINATSFYPTKNLGALGDGGAITTNDSSLAEKARQFRNYGSLSRFQHSEIGVNSRLDDIQAAVLSVKLRKLDGWNRERRKLAKMYKEMLVNVGDLQIPVEEVGAFPVYHLFVCCTERRDALRDALRQQGVETDVHYPVPPHLQPAYASLGFSPGSFPVAETICSNIMSLPLWPGMDEEHISHVCGVVRKFFGA